MDESILVCGAGHQGITMAAHLALNGVSVNLWNRTEKNIAQLMETHKVSCTGVVNGTANLNCVSSKMEETITNVVMITTPSIAHKDIAKEMASYVNKDMVIVLNPGRTFGALEFKNTLLECGVQELPHIAETQTIIYTCRKEKIDSSVIYALKDDVKIASVRNDDIEYILGKIPKCIGNYFTPVESYYLTSLSNVGMVLHCAPVLMNIGWIETEKVDFKYYYDGISPSVAKFLEKIDLERISVAKALGYTIESTSDWLKRTYNVCGENLYECIHNNRSYDEIDAPPTLNCRYIFEDIPCGLVPIEDMGKKINVQTPTISLVIDLASSVFDTDFRLYGRKYKV